MMQVFIRCAMDNGVPYAWLNVRGPQESEVQSKASRSTPIDLTWLCFVILSESLQEFCCKEIHAMRCVPRSPTR
ncbi:hypothetical protein OZ13_06420 [Xanthomonas cannabis pv. cannabis]|nr:hypothetical protein OZ10_15545 [Xanthomonas cannabis pv. cannabis]KHL57642.1 hypothetical protein OZ13_06420 [Xanthomonas cannabis pv. cannabis]